MTRPAFFYRITIGYQVIEVFDLIEVIRIRKKYPNAVVQIIPLRTAA